MANYEPPKHEAGSQKLKVLLVEDNAGDAELLRIAINRTKDAPRMNLIHFEALRPAIQFISEHPVDLVILDLTLPDSTGMDSLRAIQSVAPELPVIVCTGWDDRSVAIQGIRSGAQDYLFKGSFDYASIVPTIDYAIERQKVRNAVEGNTRQIRKEAEFKKEILEVVAHDLRSPLAGVLLQLEGILNGQLIQDLSPEQRKIFQQMHNNCQQVFQLSSGLLDLESLKSKNFLNFREVDLRPFIQKTFDSFGTWAGRKKIELKLQMSSNFPKIMADPSRMAQALNNFISNAIKFSHEKTKVTVKVSVEGSECVISVRDQGQGIPKEDQSKLFCEFSRTRIRPTAGEESTGIGLAIVKRIIDAHGGRIWVKSSPGKGSTFAFAIPLQQDIRLNS
jgi:signal transduction histidine kinase